MPSLLPTQTLTLRHWFRLIAVGLVLVVLVGVSRVGSVEWQRLQRARLAQHTVAQLRVALLAAEMVSRERGPTNAVLGHAGPQPDPQLLQRLAQARERTDRALQVHRQWLAQGAELPGGRVQIEAFAEALRSARANVDELAARPLVRRSASDIRDAVSAMVALVPRLSPALAMLTDQALQAEAALAVPVWGARLAADLREQSGQLGSLFTPALARQQPFTEAERTAIEHARGRIQQLRDLLSLRIGQRDQPAEVEQAHIQMVQRYFVEGEALLRGIEAEGRDRGRYALTPAGFAERYVPYMDAIVALRDTLLLEAERRSLAAQAQAREALLWVGALTGLLFVLVLAMLYFTRQRVVLPLTQAAAALGAMRQGDLTHPLPHPQANDEIAAVLGGIDDLRRNSQLRQELERERDKLIASLREQSTTDFLTGLPNRRAFYESAEAEMARARRHGFGLVMLVIDVDHFKQINDTLGHSAGDQALVAVADVLRRSLRQGDFAARLGGEEFVALLSHCTPEDGLGYAERLRTAIEGQPLHLGGESISRHLTVSIGLADSSAHGHELDLLLAQADAAMYRAKRAGRNRSQVA